MRKALLFFAFTLPFLSAVAQYDIAVDTVLYTDNTIYNIRPLGTRAFAMTTSSSVKDSVTLMKVDVNGTVHWRLYINPEKDILRELDLLTDTSENTFGFFTRSPPLGQSKVYLVKVDKSGKIAWSQTLDYSPMVRTSLNLSSDALLTTVLYKRPSMWLLSISPASGEIIKEVPLDLPYSTYLNGFIQDIDGNVYLFGSYDKSQNEKTTFIRKFNRQGVLLASRDFGSGRYSFAGEAAFLDNEHLVYVIKENYRYDTHQENVTTLILTKDLEEVNRCTLSDRSTARRAGVVRVQPLDDSNWLLMNDERSGQQNNRDNYDLGLYYYNRKCELISEFHYDGDEKAGLDQWPTSVARNGDVIAVGGRRQRAQRGAKYFENAMWFLVLRKASPSIQLDGSIADSRTNVPLLATLQIAGKQVTSDGMGRYAVTLKDTGTFDIRIEAKDYFTRVERVKVGSSTNTLLFSLDRIETGARINLKHVLFKQRTAILEDESKAELDLVVEMMKANPLMEIELAGHTDTRGSAKSNMQLSVDRVNVIKKYIVDHGIKSSRVSGEGYGGTKPLSTGNTEQEQRLNRRVEFTIVRM